MVQDTKSQLGRSAFGLGYDDAGECIERGLTVEQSRCINPFAPGSFLYEEYSEGWRARWLNPYEGLNETAVRGKKRKQ